MNTNIHRLFDIPRMMRQRFGDGHPAFYSHVSESAVTTPVKTYLEQSNNFSNYLLDQGLKKGEYVVTILSNSPDWNAVEIGILQAGGIHVPLSPFYTPGQLKSILKLVKPAWVFTSSNSTTRRIQSIIAITGTPCRVENIKRYNLLQYNTTSSHLEDRKQSVAPDDTAVVLFTSGSTGTPKGCVLSHQNILSSVNEFSKADFFNDCEKSISFLQLALSGERKVNYSCQVNGISVCYPAPHKDMWSNIRLFQPQITALVPFLLKELYQQIATAPKSFTLRNILCGGASVSPEMIRLYKEKDTGVFELYGLTETASLLAFNTMTCSKAGTVGKIAGSVEVKFSEESELWVKGPNVMKGYLQDDGQPEIARDNASWFHTGDIGQLDREGYLKITGRRKSAFKNSRGSYIHPEEIERELMAGNLFDFVIVTGDHEDSLSAIVKPKDRSTGRNEIRELINSFNHGKNDELKITRFLILNGDTDNGIFTASLKPDRQKISDLINSNKFVPV